MENSYFSLFIVGKQIGRVSWLLRDVPAVRKKQGKTLILLTINFKMKYILKI